MKTTISLLFIFVSAHFFAQVLPDRKVFATAGRDLKNQSATVPPGQNNKVTFTMGEPIIGLSTITGRRLSMGFIQPDGIVPVGPPSPVQIMVNDPFFIAPNPAYNYTIIKAPEQWQDKVNIQLIDGNGKLIQTAFMEGAIYEFSFDQHLAPGNYFINFYKEDGTFLQQSKLMKINKQ
jgi:hypothetical protein